jgi:hypothetical protein
MAQANNGRLTVVAVVPDSNVWALNFGYKAERRCQRRQRSPRHTGPAGDTVPDHVPSCSASISRLRPARTAG